MLREYIYLTDDDIRLTPICEDCGPNAVPIMRKEEIVRCKDCRDLDEEGKCYRWMRYMPEDGFCYVGERKPDETD